MKIWKIISSEKNVVLNHYDENLFDRLNEMRGQSLQKEWVPFEVYIEGNKRKKKDFASFLPAFPVVNKKTKELLEGFVGEKVEFLPLISEQVEFFLCNIVNLKDCVDKEKSVAKYKQDSKEVFIYREIHFKREILDEKDNYTIFKIAETPTKGCFVSDEFKELIENSLIHGPQFDLIWDSEQDEEKEFQQRAAYKSYVEAINNSTDLTMDWEAVMNYLQQGGAAISDHWKIQLDENGDIFLGTLNLQLDYEFMNPLYVPPILLDLKWKTEEKTVL